MTEPENQYDVFEPSNRRQLIGYANLKITNANRNILSEEADKNKFYKWQRICEFFEWLLFVLAGLAAFAIFLPIVTMFTVSNFIPTLLLLSGGGISAGLRSHYNNKRKKCVKTINDNKKIIHTCQNVLDYLNGRPIVLQEQLEMFKFIDKFATTEARNWQTLNDMQPNAEAELEAKFAKDKESDKEFFQKLRNEVTSGGNPRDNYFRR